MSSNNIIWPDTVDRQSELVKDLLKRVRRACPLDCIPEYDKLTNSLLKHIKSWPEIKDRENKNLCPPHDRAAWTNICHKCGIEVDMNDQEIK